MTESFEGRLYSATSSAGGEVVVRVDGTGRLRDEGGLPPVHFREIRISPRVGNGARYLDLPDGRRIETLANDAVDRLERRWTGARKGFVHRLEASRRAVLFSVLALAVCAWAFVVHGVPAIGRASLTFIPVSMDDRLGRGVLEQLDEALLSPTALPAERQAELRALFRRLVPADGRDYRLEFRASEVLGANALALPNAWVVFTDDMVELAPDDAMLAAIMLHEIGHVVERHVMQAVVGQSSLAVGFTLITGDINGIAAILVAALPAFFIQASYSQDREWEADTYALEQMLARGMDPNSFADIMTRLLGTAVGGDGAEESEMEVSMADIEESPLWKYFSSHPATRLRIERFREAAPD